jgi:FKBP-type peptidyl-prolyl cis-trans isomerase
MCTVNIFDTKLGDGEIAVMGSRVRINCATRLINARYLNSEEKFFLLQEGGEAEGLVEGIVGMSVGGKRTIQGSVNCWYGEDACPYGLPSNTALVFEVELLAVN